jgi:hypothetical protein
LRKRFGQQARKDIKKFSIEDTGEQYLKLLMS